MKTYAQATTAEELKLKLIGYYTHMATAKRQELRHLSLKRECDRVEVHARFYEEQVRFLQELKLFAPPATLPDPHESMEAMFL